MIYLLRSLRRLGLRVLFVLTLIVVLAFIGWRVGAIARLEREDRRLIAALESNYASNADFRRLCK